ncbi:vanadium-dependent haloperoxidase [Tautonia plasticadhaerens]|uniref:PAP2 superfamily protein n=1 Tax=Tautonia plasticadhaerens TaxID=2527974 RepID=A0A518GUU5_9BACT|nr:vanadium-dependent haloperoxidase [Tautonia plasticadhaerens]QDV32360.1 PAP2 superfamily protein [Tautonia plasticadhaerens]
MATRIRMPGVAVLATSLVLAATAAARADVVIDWNNVTLDTIRARRVPPPPATRALAMVHAAIYDAVNGIERTHQPYFVERPAPPGASPGAAAAAAAHQVLSALFPDLRDIYDAYLTESLAGVPPNAARNKGVAWGRFVGDRILALRRDDGADRIVAYEPSGEFGRWEPTPPRFADALLPQWPSVTPFAMRAADQFLPGPPPGPASLEYAIAFHEVKELGDLGSLTRTDDQTQVAYFWEDGPGSATPPGHWQLIAQQLAATFGTTPAQNARLFALLSLTQADAAIVAWDSKYHYDHFRPYTGITRAEEDGNALTDADPDWAPLIPTPPFPSYTSGHSTFSGASAVILVRLFGDIPISSPAPDPHIWPDRLLDRKGAPVVRSWPSLSFAAEEAGRSRIYGGIHWQYDNIAGLESGRELAEFVFAYYLRPLEE